MNRLTHRRFDLLRALALTTALASASGVLGLLHCFSADEVNLGSGQGAGFNRFVADDGSELAGALPMRVARRRTAGA